MTRTVTTIGDLTGRHLGRQIRVPGLAHWSDLGPVVAQGRTVVGRFIEMSIPPLVGRGPAGFIKVLCAGGLMHDTLPLNHPCYLVDEDHSTDQEEP